MTDAGLQLNDVGSPERTGRRPSPRPWWRQRRVLVVTAVSTALVVLVFAALSVLSEELWRNRADGRKADSLHWRLSVSLALASLLLLAATMSIGPLRRLRGASVPVHLPWRRSLGVAAAVVGGIHVVFGITIHSTGWGIWKPFTRITDDNPVRFAFGVGSWLGLFVLLTFIPLVATSNSSMLRRLGAARWKWVQRIAYVSFVLIVGHVLAMQYQERRSLTHIAITAMVIGAVVMLQLAGAIVTWREAGRRRVRAP